MREMIASVQAQSYPNWQLCLADGSVDASGNPIDSVERVVAEIAASEPRIRYVHLTENGGIADNTNAALELATGDWIALIDHDDLLAPDALYEAVALMRSGKADYEMIYTDEDKVDMEGKVHFQPHLKPDFNLDLLRSNNYITHFLLVKRSLFQRVGGIRKEFDGAQDYDFILRCAEAAGAIGHVPRILYHWRCHKESTSENPFSKQYAVDAGRRAIAEHLSRMGVKGEVTATKDMGFYTVHYPIQGEPLVSIIIPSRNEVESLKKCIASIGQSSYRNYEVIVVENNSDADTFDYYRSVAPQENCVDGTTCFEGTLSGGQRLCVAVWKDGFNYSALNNFGTKWAKGSYYVLMNNDIEMISDTWLSEMLGTCQRDEVGIVGVKLYYPDDTVQHAGVVVGIGGQCPRDCPEYVYGTAWSAQRLSAQGILNHGLQRGDGGMPDGKTGYL